MAQKNQEDKGDSVFEFARKLPVNKIAVSDNMETRPNVVKRSLWFRSSHQKPKNRQVD